MYQQFDSIQSAIKPSRDLHPDQSPVPKPTPREQVLFELSAMNLPPNLVSEGVLLYFRNHCNQPCPLFNYLSQEPLSHQYPSIVLNAMLALALRRSSASEGDPSLLSERLAQRSWDMLADTYRRFDFDESYFQAVCLLAQVDYAEGRSNRARTQVALGLRLVQTRGMLDKSHYEAMSGSGYKQHQEIILTLFMLDRVFSNRDVPNPCIPETVYRLPAYLDGPVHPERSCQDHDPTSSSLSVQTFMIINSCVAMLRVWELVVQYISETLSDASQPIWHHQSSRTAILTHLLELEIRECTYTGSKSTLNSF